MRARRRLAETGRWRKFDPSLEANFTQFEPTYSVTSFFSSCYKNSYFFFCFDGFQPAGILSGGTMSGRGFESRPWRNNSPNTRP